MASRSLVVAIVLVFLPAMSRFSLAEEQKNTLLPSEALSRAFVDLAAKKGKQPDVCRSYLAQTKTSGLSDDERIALAELYYVAYMPDESKALYQTFMAGNDLSSRLAWQRVMHMNAAAYEDYAAVEQEIRQYREKFPLDSRDLYRCYLGVQGLGDHYRQAGDHQKVVDLVLAEVANLPSDVPYYSLSLVNFFADSFSKAGKQAEAARLLKQSLAAFESAKKHPGPLGWPAKPWRLEETQNFAVPEAIHKEVREAVERLK